jgi:hypothetical protein
MNAHVEQCQPIRDGLQREPGNDQGISEQPKTWLDTGGRFLSPWPT